MHAFATFLHKPSCRCVYDDERERREKGRKKERKKEKAKAAALRICASCALSLLPNRSVRNALKLTYSILT